MNAWKLGFYNFIISMKDIDGWLAWFFMTSMIIWVGDEHFLNMLIKDNARR